LNQKLILSGLDNEFNNTGKSSQTSSVTNESVILDVFEYNDIKIERKILMADGDVIFHNTKRFGNKIEFEQACKKLRKYNLGKYSDMKKNENSGSKKKAACFIKTDTSGFSDEKKLDFSKVLMKFRVDIDEYSTSLKRKVNNGDFNDDDDDDYGGIKDGDNDDFQPAFKRTKLMDSK
jgi:hypothetical protein